MSRVIPKKFIARATGSQIACMIGWVGYDDASATHTYWTEVDCHEKEFNDAALARMAYGNINEPNAVATLSRIWGVPLLETPYIFDYQYHWLRCISDAAMHVDPIDGNPSLVECKSPASMYRHPPHYYLPQLYMEMRIYGIPKVYLNVWTTKEIRVWLFLWDDKMILFFMRMLLKFRACCEANILPFENIIPYMGHIMESWATSDYSEKERAVKIKTYKMGGFMPPTPIFQEVYHAFGDFVPKDGRFRVNSIKCNMIRRMKDLCTGKISPRNAFETRLIEVSKHKCKLPDDMKPYPR